MLNVLRRLGASRAGTVATMVAMASPVALAGVGFGLDRALIEVSRTQLQSAADASALAGARALGGASTAMTTEAIALAQANMPATRAGSVLVAADIVAGVWDAGAHSFTATSVNPNAVRTTTRLAAANGNAHPLIFGAFLDMPTANLAATAIARAATLPSCATEPYFSYIDAGQPARTDIATLSDGSLVPHLKDREGHPLIRVDNGYDGQAEISFEIAGHGTYRVTVPGRGHYAVAVTSIVDAGPPGSMTLAFGNVRSVPVNPGGTGGGAATWVNRANVADPLPGTPICQGTATAATTRSVAKLVG